MPSLITDTVKHHETVATQRPKIFCNLMGTGSDFGIDAWSSLDRGLRSHQVTNVLV